MGCLSSKSVDPYAQTSIKKASSLENDPDLQFEPYVEKRFIVWARHPDTGERLRAQLLRKNISRFMNSEEFRPEFSEENLQDGNSHLVRWARYHLKESGSDSVISHYTDEDIEKTPSTRFSHYLSFVQTVGSPGFEYKQGEEVFCKDKVDQWHRATITAKEKNYYFVKYKDQTDNIGSEWIHAFSTRLRKMQKYEGVEHNSEPWTTFYEMDWIRVRHPTNNVYLPAKIISKDPEGDSMIIQYEDPSLLVKQETISQRDINKDPKKIEDFNQWKRRWRYNRVYIYSRALASVGLRIHPMSGENGHSLFRSLSHQLFGTEDNFLYLRLRCLEHISTNKEYFANFVDINFEYYVAHKRKGVEGEFFSMGDHLDIQAICELYDVRVEIYSELSPRPLDTIRFYQQMGDLPVLRLSYRGANHYDSISSVDSPLPITVEKNLRQVPLGDHFSEAKVIFKAREDLFERVKEQDKADSVKLKNEAIFIRAQGLVAFPRDDEYERIKSLCEELGLKDAMYSSQVFKAQHQSDESVKGMDPHKPYIFQSQNNQDIRFEYPAAPWPEQEASRLPKLWTRAPLLRVEGIKFLVDKCLNYLEQYAAFKPKIRIISVASRITFSLNPEYKRNLTHKLYKAKAAAYHAPDEDDSDEESSDEDEAADEFDASKPVKQ